MAPHSGRLVPSPCPASFPAATRLGGYDRPIAPASDAASLELQLAAARPGAFRLARRMGLSEPDAEDAAHQAILECLLAIRSGAYVAARGTVARWLGGVVRHRVVDHWRRLARLRSRMTGQDCAEIIDLPFDTGSPSASGTLGEQVVLSLALDELADASRGANRGADVIRATIAGISVGTLAQGLDTRPALLSLAKHRSLPRLEAIVRRLASTAQMA